MTLIDPAPRRIGELPVAAGPVAFGCWRLTGDDPAHAADLVTTALESGMTLIDTADVYGYGGDGSGFGAAEAVLGRVLADEPSLREAMILTTKGGVTPPVPYDSSAAHLRAACEASLRRLGTDTIDLYFVHRPDTFTHPAEVAAALTELRDAGKIRTVGVSNHTPAQHEALAAHLDFPIAATQPEWSALHLDPMRDGTFDLCMRDGVTPLAWSPLGGGALATGSGVPSELIATLDRLAARENADRATVALGFALAHPSRPVAIVGTQRASRLVSAMNALKVWLDRNDVYDIVEASDGRPLP